MSRLHRSLDLLRLAAFGFPYFGGISRIVVWMACSRMCSSTVFGMRMCLGSVFGSYICVPSLVLWGVKFVLFGVLSCIGALVWCMGGGIGLMFIFPDLRNVY